SLCCRLGVVSARSSRHRGRPTRERRRATARYIPFSPVTTPEVPGPPDVEARRKRLAKWKLDSAAGLSARRARRSTHLKRSNCPSSHHKMRNTMMVPKHPPLSFFTPQPAASALIILLMLPPSRAVLATEGGEHCIASRLPERPRLRSSFEVHAQPER